MTLIPFDELLDLYEGLLAIVATARPQYIVVEIADGILQRETEMLLRCKEFMDTVSHVIFSAPESLSALSGIQFLADYGVAPMAVSGLFTASPLLRAEVACRTSVPVMHISEIGTAAVLDLMEKNLGNLEADVLDINQGKPKGIFHRMTVASAG